VGQIICPVIPIFNNNVDQLFINRFNWRYQAKSAACLQICPSGKIDHLGVHHLAQQHATQRAYRTLGTWILCNERDNDMTQNVVRMTSIQHASINSANLRHPTKSMNVFLKTSSKLFVRVPKPETKQNIMCIIWTCALQKYLSCQYNNDEQNTNLTIHHAQL